jgi:hypothetical protein
MYPKQQRRLPQNWPLAEHGMIGAPVHVWLSAPHETLRRRYEVGVLAQR